MNPEGTKVLDKGVHVFDGHDAHPTVEGPKCIKETAITIFLLRQAALLQVGNWC
jgi:hypothetical protein